MIVDSQYKLFIICFEKLRLCLVRVGETTHTRHDAEDVVVSGVDADLGSVGTLDSGVREDELEGGVVDAREVARSRWLVLLWLEGERVDVDTSVWGASVVLVWLDEVEVGSLTLGEAVLAVKLELSDNDWVLTPAVEVKTSLGKDEGTGIRDTRVKVGVETWLLSRWPYRGCDAGSILYTRWNVEGTSILEETRAINESTRDSGVRSTEGVDGVWKGIKGISVVEWLST